MTYATRLDAPKKISLADYDPDDTGKAKKSDSADELLALGGQLGGLQELLYAAQKNGVLIVLQGMDTSGKDGTISHVMAQVNPQGCAVASFKVPTPEEQAHDFLWRVHQKAPARGMLTIFNRSHYEDVLVTRVHGLIDAKECERRYDHIRRFEQLLTDSGTIILKFFLHISKKEQEERLLAREQEPDKAWKLSAGDWKERTYWKEYQAAYEDALGATASKDAPWYIVPANHKWFRNLAIAQAIVATLKPYEDRWYQALTDLGEMRKQELAALRSQTEGSEKE